MNFTSVKTSARIIMEAGLTPLLVGERGIGKTSLARTIAKEAGWEFVNVDANLLKEGEIGGIPVIEDKTKRKITKYAIHHKILQIIKNDKNNKKSLLFLDELNRCQFEVMQELMNLILNREINGIKVPKSCYILAAINPSASSDDSNTGNYTVTTMDAAQKDRFVWLNLDSDLQAWIDWATSNKKKKNEETEEENETLKLKKPSMNQNIETEIIEFLTMSSDLLNVVPTENDDIVPSPRSWESASKILAYYKENKGIISEQIFFNMIKGAVGNSASLEFIKFFKERKNPLLPAKDFFSLKENEVINTVKNETTPRQLLIFKNAINDLNSAKSKKKASRFIKVLTVVPKDLMVTIMKSIKNNEKKLHNYLSNEEEYLDLFMDMHEYLK